MDQTYRVVLTDEAALDLEQAVNWIKEDSVEAAHAFFVRIKTKIKTNLSKTPLMGVQLQSLDGRDLIVLTCSQHRVFYVVDEDQLTVSVIRLLHTSRDIRSILKLAA